MAKNLAKFFKHYELDTDFWWWCCNDCGEWFQSDDIVVLVTPAGNSAKFCPKCGSKRIGLEY